MTNHLLKRWPLLLCVVSCILSGCQGYNPFYPASTQVPPPPTGAAARSDPYYQPSASNSSSERPTTYSARRNRRSRFTSDRKNNQEPEPIDTSLDTSANMLPESDYRNRNADVSHRDDLDWRRPPEADTEIAPASAYDRTPIYGSSSRPRPRFQ